MKALERVLWVVGAFLIVWDIFFVGRPTWLLGLGIVVLVGAGIVRSKSRAASGLDDVAEE